MLSPSSINPGKFRNMHDHWATRGLASKLSLLRRGSPRVSLYNSNNRKNWKRTEDDGKREKAEASLLSSTFPSCPARSLFLSPQAPNNTKRPLQRRERCKVCRQYLKAICVYSSRLFYPSSTPGTGEILPPPSPPPLNPLSLQEIGWGRDFIWLAHCQLLKYRNLNMSFVS